jgi:hypothetical protein
MVFSSVLEDTKKSGSVSNVSIAYNSNDTTQRNAIYQAQQKIAKAQSRQDKRDSKKNLQNTAGANPVHQEFSSIFY